jgi:hypothetical protein
MISRARAEAPSRNADRSGVVWVTKRTRYLDKLFENAVQFKDTENGGRDRLAGRGRVGLVRRSASAVVPAR